MGTRIFLIILLFFTIVIVPIQKIHAQEKDDPSPTSELSVPDEVPETGTNLSVSPVFLNLATDPGENVSSSIEVTNNNNFTEYLELDIVKFELIDNGNGLRLEDVDAGDEFVDWVAFKEKRFSIGANEHKKVNFSITPSKDAALGYYYAVVVKRINEVKGDAAPAVAGYPAVPLILEVRSPNATRELQLVDFKTNTILYEYLPTNFELKVKNTGNIHIIPVGDIFIDWGGAKNIGMVRANPGRSNVLPNSERTITASWDDGFIVVSPKLDSKGVTVKNSKGATIYTTKWDFTKVPKFRIGKYTAHLLLVYDSGKRDVPLEATVSFWVIPWRLILVALAILLTPITVLRLGLLVVVAVGNSFLLSGNPLLFILAAIIYTGVTILVLQHAKKHKK